MTAHTHKRPRQVRRSSVMESLGFSDSPFVTHSAPPSPRPRSHLVSTAVKPAHTVEEMWNTTELHYDSLVDWNPGDVEKRLDKGVRWPLIFIWVLILGLVGSSAYWLWQERISEASVVVQGVQEAASGLGETLDALAAAAGTIAAEPGHVDPAILESSGATDEASRALFSAAAELPATKSSTRAIASDAATAALEASGALTSTAAYIGAVAPVLTAPDLVTDPTLIDLATAATDFGGWRARFELMLTAIPDGVLTPVTTELSNFGNELEAIQGSYLDALRNDDGVAAGDVVRQLEARITSMWIVLRAEADAERVEILERIEAARAAVLSLTG